MTKPHEETWIVQVDGYIGRDLSTTHGMTPGAYAPAIGRVDAERAPLAAQAPAMARLLLKVIADADDGGEVGYALGYKTTDEIRAILRAAGVLPPEAVYCPHGVLAGIRCATCEDAR